VKDQALARIIGSVIRTRRLELELSQVSLAATSGFKRAYIASIERGEKAITVENVRIIATALGLSIVDFFRRVEAAS
jgi:transcriptional regulator with XRE-family HTH domain